MRHATPIGQQQDLRVMNRLATLMLGLVLVFALLAVGLWGLRHPAFALQGITVHGDTVHNTAASLRTHVVPRLQGNFFTLDLGQARTVFESVPWVRKVIVRREFPNRLGIWLQEHQVAAYWSASRGTRLLNQQGEIFEADADDLDQDDLPRLSGPDGTAVQVLHLHGRLQNLAQSAGLHIAGLDLTSRGTWRMTLDNDAVIELGRGSPDEVQQRVADFFQTLKKVAAQYGRNVQALVSADLRHPDGYALRLQGVTTTDAENQRSRS